VLKHIATKIYVEVEANRQLQAAAMSPAVTNRCWCVVTAGHSSCTCWQSNIICL